MTDRSSSHDPQTAEPPIDEHLSRLARLLDAEQRSGDDGLLPVQRQALVYLSRANRYSDRPAAVAEYLAITRGTASQTLRVLEERGLVTKREDPDDRRRVHLQLTAAGRRLAESRSSEALRAGLDRLGTGGERRLRVALLELLQAVQEANGHRAFGVCRTCRHFQTPEVGGHRCGLTGEGLSVPESALLCREHEAPEEAETVPPNA